MSKITLLNTDCMDFMRSQPDKACDLAIVDPPYGIKEDSHRQNNRSKLARSRNYHKALWDQDRPGAEYFTELERVSKNQIIWGGNHFADLIGKASSCWIVWDKHTGSSHFSDCELAYTSFKTAVRKFDYPWNGMIQGFHGNKKLNEDRIHPAQKPRALYRWLLHTYASPDMKILDTHVGSASSAIEAHYFGCEFVGCELDPEYYHSGVKRFQLETRQQTLPLEVIA